MTVEMKCYGVFNVVTADDAGFIGGEDFRSESSWSAEEQ